MIETKEYIKAIDILIDYYERKISELEDAKHELLMGKSREETKEERTVVDTQEWYDIMNGRVVRRIKYSDGTYEDEPIVRKEE